MGLRSLTLQNEFPAPAWTPPKIYALFRRQGLEALAEELITNGSVEVPDTFQMTTAPFLLSPDTRRYIEQKFNPDNAKKLEADLCQEYGIDFNVVVSESLTPEYEAYVTEVSKASVHLWRKLALVDVYRSLIKLSNMNDWVNYNLLVQTVTMANVAKFLGGEDEMKRLTTVDGMDVTDADFQPPETTPAQSE